MTKEGQTLWDLTIQLSGSIEQLGEYTVQFTDIDAAIPAGTDITTGQTNNVSKWYIDNSLDVATLGGEEAGAVDTLPSSAANPVLGVTTLQGQNVWDLTTQYGDIEQLGQFTAQFTDIDSAIPAGTEITTGENTRFSKYFVNYGQNVATTGDEMGIQLGFDYIIEFGLN